MTAGVQETDAQREGRPGGVSERGGVGAWRGLGRGGVGSLRGSPRERRGWGAWRGQGEEGRGGGPGGARGEEGRGGGGGPGDRRTRGNTAVRATVCQALTVYKAICITGVISHSYNLLDKFFNHILQLRK